MDENGKLVARIHQQSESSSAPGEQPRERVTTKLDIPSEGIHQTMVQNSPFEGQKESAVKVSLYYYTNCSLSSNKHLRFICDNSHCRLKYYDSRRCDVHNEAELQSNGYI